MTCTRDEAQMTDRLVTLLADGVDLSSDPDTNTITVYDTAAARQYRVVVTEEGS